jgi:diguanylate cyclase (GGDEF)-like protein
MKRTDKDGASEPADPDTPVEACRHTDGMPAAPEKNISHKNNAVIKNEAAVLSREKSVSVQEDAINTRENAVDLRENAAHLREEAVQDREREANLRNGVADTREGFRAAVPAPDTSDNHMNNLQEANEHLVIATLEARKLTEQVQIAKDHLDHLAHHDVLTDLPNRILLQDRLGQAIELAHRQGRQLAVMFMDIDQFKHVNDSLGHAVGDQLLQSVAQRLKACVRHSDTVSRQGGDEFVLLLPFIEHPEDAALSAQKLLATIAEPHHLRQHDLHASVSIGISVYPNDGQDAETLIMNADAAMYNAKEKGRNTYSFFRQDMNDRAVWRQSTEASLRNALERHEFVLHYQPKINFQSGAIVGVEALIRWRHPERGLLAPAQFVSIAEDCGLILSIGRWVLREACHQARVWLQMGLPPITIAVNTSALEFRANDFLEYIRETLDDTGLEPRYLQLELTESILMKDSKSANTVLHALAELGVKLAVDDFGTGYSSLSYLKQFPIDTLKIDQSFVRQMTSNPEDAIIVSTVISMGNSLKKHIIAEGVETQEQYALLRAQHCDEGQGNYFCCPQESEALAALLKTGLPPFYSH